VENVKILKIPGWFIKLFAGWLFFLFVWGTYRILRRRSLNIRFKATLILAFLIYCLFKGKRERIKRNVALIRPDLTEQQISQYAWRIVRTIARSWAAMLGNEFAALEEISRKLKAEGEIEQILSYHQTGKKTVATMVHVGPVDEMAGIIPLFGLNVYVPAEAMKPKWFFNLMMRLRLRFEGIIYDSVEKGQTLLRAAQHLSDGHIVLLAVDLPRKSGNGVSCQIGKARAIFPVGAVKLALEQNATIFPVFPSWEEDWTVKVRIGEPFVLIRTGDMAQDIEINTRRLIEEIYAPHILENLDSWLRLPWNDLEQSPTDLM